MWDLTVHCPVPDTACSHPPGFESTEFQAKNQTADLPFLQPQAGCHWDLCTQLQHPFKMHLQLIPFLTRPKYPTSIAFHSHNEDIEKVNVVDISSLRLCDR